MSGEAVLDSIKNIERFRDMKILLISGSYISELKRHVDKGADDFLTKPFDNDVLLKIGVKFG